MKKEEAPNSPSRKMSLAAKQNFVDGNQFTNENEDEDIGFVKQDSIPRN